MYDFDHVMYDLFRTLLIKTKISNHLFSFLCHASQSALFCLDI